MSSKKRLKTDNKILGKVIQCLSCQLTNRMLEIQQKNDEIAALLQDNEILYENWKTSKPFPDELKKEAS